MWGYYVAGGWLLACGLVLWFFAGISRLNRATTTRPDPVHPDDWAPDAALWDEGDHDA
jgi:hypothetical protein